MDFEGSMINCFKSLDVKTAENERGKKAVTAASFRTEFLRIKTVGHAVA
jgi:hypothetical protein